MKTHLKWTAVVFAVCMAVLLAPPLSRAEGTGRTITVGPKENLTDVMKTAGDGDIIALNAGCHATLRNDTPWVIDKSVTFEGGDVTLWVGGIILDADVTFRNTTLSFGAFVRNAIMANGHTLTLENVTCAENGRPLNLFCGGLYDTELGSTQCTAGTVVIRGRTSLKGSINTVTDEVGNIYAGNLCMGGMTEAAGSVNGPDNICQGNAKIIIEADSTSTLGKIYAGGAQQKIPEDAPNGKVILTDPEAYKVSGTVRVQLHAATVDYVNGRGAAETHVTYTDTREYPYLMDGLGVYCVSSLTVESGHVSPKADSSFAEGASLTVNPGARLGLANLGDLTVDTFTGGGAIDLGQQQTLTISGAVTGKTEVVIGGFNSAGGSNKMPLVGYSYICAGESLPGAFTLIPPVGQSMAFSRNESGEWIAVNSAEKDPVIVSNFRFLPEVVFLDSGTDCAELSLSADYGSDRTGLDFLPLEIRVNGVSAVAGEGEELGEYYWTGDTASLKMYMAEDWLIVESQTFAAPLPDGVYRIEITVPGEHTASGEPLSAAGTLTVGSGGDLPESGVIGGVEVSGGTGNTTVKIYLAAPGGPVKAGTVMAAVYSANGKLLSFGSAQVPEGGSTSVEVPVNLSGAKGVKAFLADGPETMNPLCPSQGIPIN